MSMTDMPPRTLSRALARVVTELELEQPTLVSLDDLAELARRHGLGTHVRELARRLRVQGWLLPTGRPGVFEFAPGAHAGPYGHGDPFIQLRAELRAVPDLPVRLALVSALWAHGLADRAPDRHEVSLPPRAPAPAPLRRAFRLVRFDPRCVATDLNGVPSSTAATLLVHLAARPTDVHGWSQFGEVLPDLVERSTVEELREELTGRPATVQARLGYLLQGIATEVSEELGLRPGRGTVWFGPRDKLLRFDNRWNVADTVLPFDPRLPGDPEVLL